MSRTSYERGTENRADTRFLSDYTVISVLETIQHGWQLQNAGELLTVEEKSQIDAAAVAEGRAYAQLQGYVPFVAHRFMHVYPDQNDYEEICQAGRMSIYETLRTYDLEKLRTKYEPMGSFVVALRHKIMKAMQAELRAYGIKIPGDIRRAMNKLDRGDIAIDSLPANVTPRRLGWGRRAQNMLALETIMDTGVSVELTDWEGIPRDTEASHREPIDETIDHNPEAAAFEAVMKEDVDYALANLSNRERSILEMRFGLIDNNPRSLEEVGKEFDLTRERIRQIEAKAMSRLRWPGIGPNLHEHISSSARVPYSSSPPLDSVGNFIPPKPHKYEKPPKLAALEQDWLAALARMPYPQTVLHVASELVRVAENSQQNGTHEEIVFKTLYGYRTVPDPEHDGTGIRRIFNAEYESLKTRPEITDPLWDDSIFEGLRQKHISDKLAALLSETTFSQRVLIVVLANVERMVTQLQKEQENPAKDKNW